MRILILSALALTAGLAAAQQATGYFNIVDGDGFPIPQVNAHITMDEHDVDFERTTNRAGQFKILGLQIGTVKVTLTRDGYQTRTCTYNQSEKQQRVALLMLKDGVTPADIKRRPTLEGVIENTSGEPLEGVTVTVTTEGIDSFEETAVTNASGEWEVEALYNIIAKLSVKKEGYRDILFTWNIYTDDEKVRPPLKMQTLEEAYAELGIENPKNREKTPKEKAIDLYNLAVDPYRNENWDQAEKYAEEAIELDPEMDNTLRMLVWINQKQEDWEKVLTYGSRYLEKSTENENIYKVTLIAAERLGNTAKIEELKSMGMSQGLINPSDLFNQAVDALNNMNDEKATGLLNQVLEMDETFARAYYELGKIKVREFEFEEAVKYLRTFLKHAPKDDPLRKEAEDLIITLLE